MNYDELYRFCKIYTEKYEEFNNLSREEAEEKYSELELELYDKKELRLYASGIYNIMDEEFLNNLPKSIREEIRIYRWEHEPPKK
ncbi:hypothetical protein [uncultured Methanobrevibacter sp.]|uniref:hypothetical protein n=1 Tax=uncultured Methanobrevibacter sp. TaxID=253161 RepID=UPI0025D6B211|nr:hypothetical protein [uncultured Methanobrevibacter sp.]